MKKLLCLLLVLCLAGCGAAPGGSSGSSSAGASSAPPASSSAASVPVSSSVVPASSDESAPAGGLDLGELTVHAFEFAGISFTISLPEGLYPSGDGIHMDSHVVPETVLLNDGETSKICWFTLSYPEPVDADTYKLSRDPGSDGDPYSRGDGTQAETFYTWNGYDVLVVPGAVGSFQPPMLLYYWPENGMGFGCYYEGTLEDAKAYYDAIIGTVEYA